MESRDGPDLALARGMAHGHHVIEGRKGKLAPGRGLQGDIAQVLIRILDPVREELGDLNALQVPFSE